MSEENSTEAEAETPKPKKAKAKPVRVRMVNMNPANGTVGGIANPFEKDVPAWEARGWVRD